MTPRLAARASAAAVLRICRHVGRLGVLGAGAALAGAAVLATLEAPGSEPPRDVSEPVLTQVASAPMPPVALHLPPHEDIALLLTLIEKLAHDEGLSWPRSTYRLEPPGEDSPATLHIEGALKGNYLQLRRFISAFLRDVPAATLGELGIARAASDATELEAKVVIIVFLSGGDAVPEREASAPRLASLDRQAHDDPQDAFNPRRLTPEPVADAPASQSSAPPVEPLPTPPAPAAPPPPPSPPFSAIGTWTDAQGMGVFLADSSSTRLARVGDTVAGEYRIEQITAAEIVLIHQPSRRRTTVPVPRPAGSS